LPNREKFPVNLGWIFSEILDVAFQYVTKFGRPVRDKAGNGNQGLFWKTLILKREK